MDDEAALSPAGGFIRPKLPHPKMHDIAEHHAQEVLTLSRDLVAGSPPRRAGSPTRLYNVSLPLSPSRIDQKPFTLLKSQSYSSETMQRLLACSVGGVKSFSASSPTRDFVIVPPPSGAGERDDEGEEESEEENERKERRGEDKREAMELGKEEPERGRRKEEAMRPSSASSLSAPTRSLQAIARSLAAEEEASGGAGSWRIPHYHETAAAASNKSHPTTPLRPHHHTHAVEPLVDHPDPSAGPGSLLATKNVWRDLYMSHFSGLDAYGQSGMTKLEELVDAALNACENARRICPANADAFGAALLTQKGRIYVGCSLESSTNPLLNVSAERTVILKAVSEGDSKFLALVIATDTNDTFPAPDGSSRQYLAEFGMFPVFLVNRDLQIQSTSTAELYPFKQSQSRRRKRVASTAPVEHGKKHSPQKVENEALRIYRKHLNPRDWTPDQVIEWLSHEVELPEYADNFRHARIDGIMLFNLMVDHGRPLEESLNIRHPLHRRKLLLAINKIKEVETEALGGVALEGLDDYIAKLDRGRMAFIARNKVIFDEEDKEKTGQLDADQVRSAVLTFIGEDAEGAIILRDSLNVWIQRLRDDEKRVDFTEFVTKVSSLLQHDHDVSKKNHSSNEKKNGSTKRIKLINGHVSLKATSSKGGGEEGESKPASLQQIADQLKGDDDDDVDKGHVKKGKSDDESKTAYDRGHSSSRNDSDGGFEWDSIHKLAQVKDVFDRFAIQGLMTAPETIQALLEIGCTAPRKEIVAYLRSRKILGTRRDVSFYELLRGTAALSLPPPQQQHKVSPAPPRWRRENIDDQIDLLRRSHSPPRESVRSPPGARGKSKHSRPSPRERSRSKHRHHSPDNEEEEEDSVTSKRRRHHRHESESPRAHPSSRRPKHEKSEYEVGDQVEARFEGGSRYHMGKISRVHDVGTYDITYVDGDEEKNVSWWNIRPLDDDDGSASPKHRPRRDLPEFEKGDRVEARFHGRNKWFVGKIIAAHRDDTYDIRYEDGDQEKNVDAEMIRALDRKAIDAEAKFSPRAASPSSERYDIDEKVEARFRGRSKWFKGKIIAVHRDDTYDIQYENGDKETNVIADFILKVGKAVDHEAGAKKMAKKTSSTVLLEEGNKVEARFRGGKKWFNGRITAVNRNGTYGIRYEDGDRESNVELLDIRLPGDELSLAEMKDKSIKRADSIDAYEVGDKVEARFRGRSEYFKGKIIAAHRDGTYDIRYEDGDEEKDVKPEMIRALNRKPVEFSAAARSPSSGRYKVGDKVEARFRGRSKWFRGKITATHRDGTYDIDYEDGEKETNVDTNFIRPIEGNKPTDREADAKKTVEKTSNVLPEEGDKVEARFRGGKKWFKARIIALNRNGTYDIRYEDGDRESNVEVLNIRRPGDELSLAELKDRAVTKKAASVDVHAVGDKVEARFRGRAQYFKGKIIAAHRDGSYDVRYEDGDEEKNVKPEMIRALDGKPINADAKPSSSRRYEVNEKVEARFRGRSKWFKGKIIAVHRDNSYDIQYEDGDKETNVTADFIRPIDGGKPADREADAKKTVEKTSSTVLLEEGDKVEARFRGGKKWFNGRITAINRNGTYGIQYEDGDRESNVELLNIRRPGEELSLAEVKDKVVLKKADSTDVFEVGDKVEARFRGRAQYFKGKIIAMHRDGTYDIRYEDGDEEKNVKPEMIRASDRKPVIEADAKPSLAAARSPSSGRYDVGEKVEARFRGRAQYFKGKVIAVHRDGTYDIRYEDGDEEKNVIAEMIRGLYHKPTIEADAKASSLAAPSSSGLYDVGEKVEARFRGRSKWFNGKIMAVHRDNSYDIQYEDGDKETNVIADYIRPIDGGKPADREADSKKTVEKTSSTVLLEEGDKVEARFRGGKKWFNGRITAVNRNGTYGIQYEDGDRESNVELLNIRRPGEELSLAEVKDKVVLKKADSTDVFEVGDKVEARFRGRAQYFKGKIIAMHRDGTYDIRYEEGDEEKNVKPEMIRASDRKPVIEADAKPSLAAARSPSSGRYDVGEKVEARFRGRAQYFKGKVIAVHRDGTYDIRYEDGDEEKNVIAEMIRGLDRKPVEADAKASSLAAPSSSGLYDVGEKVEARFRGRSKWFKGKIIAVHRDNSYDIQYEDGDKETNVIADYIRPIDGGKPADREADAKKTVEKTSSTVLLEEGDKVEARFRGGKKWFNGRIIAINRNGTYGIQYEDGDRESNVELLNIRRPGEELSLAEVKDKVVLKKADSTDVFEVGDKVEARFRGRAQYFKGKIIAMHRDGTYDIRYEDGDEEKNVKPEMIRASDRKPVIEADAKPSLAAARSPSSGRYDVGEKVEARFRGRAQYFKGKVIAVHRDGTYDIRYEDGDEEKNVIAEMIRGLDRKPVEADAKASSLAAPSSSGLYDVGEKVEARFRGRSKWFKGKIIAVHRDNSYDIQYEDGDKETNVIADYIRPIDGGKPADREADAKKTVEKTSSTVLLEEGDKVEARFRGGKKWFNGRITAVNRNGTYGIQYEDGDRESNVELLNIRRPGEELSLAEVKDKVVLKKADSTDVFEVGDKVEARFRGRAQYFKGKIIAMHRDGTYDIRYEDGNEEKNVKPEMIRASDRKPVIEADAKPSLAAARSPSSGRYDVGEKVEARFRGRAQYFKGKVIAVHRDGTYDIRYEDGDEEKNVIAEMIRGLDRKPVEADAKASSLAAPSSSGLYDVGEKVEARFRGRSKWFNGKIMAVHRDNSYDIQYEDGDKETNVIADYIRPIDGGKPADREADAKKTVEKTSSTVLLEEGDKVEARFRGGKKWFNGRITAVNRNGTYGIQYEDGDRESNVELLNIRRPGEELSLAEVKDKVVLKKADSTDVFEVGDKVEARFRGRAQYFKGKIIAMHRDGTYDIRYEDGNEEKNVKPEMIRASDRKPVIEADAKPSLAAARSPSSGRYDVGEKVEARFRGRAQYFKGKVIAVHRDGTYDIRYEDGDEEKNVIAEMIRGLDRKPVEADAKASSLAAPSSSGLYDVGEKVEARFRGRSKWFNGKIMAVHRDNSYDIQYEDGDKETNVIADYIRPIDGGKPADREADAKKTVEKTSSTVLLEEGDKVEARFRGGKKWFNGRIIAINRNGTYGIQYEDGDRESNVELLNIRRPREELSLAEVKDKVVLKKADSTDVFEVGDKVEARFRGRAQYFKGKIIAMHRDGTYDIRYEDGDEEKNVKPEMIRASDRKPVIEADAKPSLAAARSPSSGRYDVGEKVEARFRGRAQYFKGKVIAVHRDGTYDIRYEDGDEEKNVIAEMIRGLDRKPVEADAKASSLAAPSSSGLYDVGEKVEARFRGRSKWFNGKIMAVHRDNSYDIQYEDGDKETNVIADYIRPIDGGKPADREADAKKTVEKTSSTVLLEEGDKVEARFRGGKKWFNGRITAVNRNGTYGIQYEDGDRESNVELLNIRRPGEELSLAEVKDKVVLKKADSTDVFEVGDKVEARFRGRAQYFKGKIIAMHRDGTYDIRYEDGNEEKNVKPEMIRASDRKPVIEADAKPSLAAARSPSSGRYDVGEKVEARFRGRAQYFKGKVIAVHRDGTYDIRYEDGDEEKNVIAEMIRGLDRKPVEADAKASSLAAPSSSGLYDVGEKVEARFRGRSKWFNGKIMAVHRDNSYDIQYEDGDKETNVIADYIRPIDGGKPADREADAKKTVEKTSSTVLLEEGDKVEARFRGGKKWFNGRITAVNRNGTYGIQYEDGDRESNVELLNIRRPGEELSLAEVKDKVVLKKADSTDVFEVGDKVEARFRGRAQYFKGKIIAMHRDGTYDIRYEDGNEEKNVKPEMIRASDRKPVIEADAKPSLAAARSPSSGRYDVGEKVEARFRGRAQYFKGKVIAVHRDGTYDIRYEDGDEEKNVIAEMIRGLDRKPVEADAKASSLAAPSSSGLYDVGEKVEARFRGRSKWFKGKIIAVHRDNSYDIQYEDGDKETNVIADYIRPIDGGKPADREADAKKTVEKTSSTVLLEEGDKVEARFRGGKKWFNGRIIAINRNGTYGIQYEDGDRESNVELLNIRRPREELSLAEVKDKVVLKKADSTDVFEVGDKVEARFRGRAQYFKGKIIAMHRDGTYDIRYEDGDEEKNVKPEMIRASDRKPVIEADAKPSLAAARSPSSGRYDVGEKVEARFRGRAQYFKGKVIAVHRDGTYDIRYEDGDEEKNVIAEMIRGLDRKPVEADAKASSLAAPSSSGLYDVGEKVEARFRGRSKWFKGKIIAVHRDNSYDIQYEDGDKETNVIADYIRPIDGGKPADREADAKKTVEKTSSTVLLEEGDKVEARFRGGKKWFNGRITAINRNGTYGIQYEDGDRESNVELLNIRRPGEELSLAEVKDKVVLKKADSTDVFEVGDKVEARFRGRAQYFKGKVIAMHRDGTYDIRYEDGDEEKNVKCEMIRPLESRVKDSDMEAKMPSEKRSVIEVGDAIEAKFKGRDFWFKGKVISVNRNGTYDVRYEDGGEEAGIKPDAIHLLGSTKHTRPIQPEVTPKKATEKPSLAFYQEGSQIEARFRGRAQYFKGKIIGVHRNGTYDIRYEDGDEETYVKPEMIQAIAHKVPSLDLSLNANAKNGPETGPLFDLGAKVEARFRGKNHWFKGKIIKVHRDGSYGVQYEDGDEEDNIPSTHVRAA